MEVFMKKIILFATAALLLFANAAMADSIAGKVGITARGGASYIFNSEWTNEAITEFGDTLNKDIKPSIGWAAGGGLMYGITDNLAVTFDVIYLQADLKASAENMELIIGQGKTIDFSLGAQWRFMPKSRFVPYVGAGFDVLLNKVDLGSVLKQWSEDEGVTMDVANTYGGHLSAGVDFFFTPNIAFNAEIRGLYSTKGDVTLKVPGYSDVIAAKYNPTNISAFMGIRFFFP
jgi:Outer membrane protein W